MRKVAWWEVSVLLVQLTINRSGVPLKPMGSEVVSWIPRLHLSSATLEPAAERATCQFAHTTCSWGWWFAVRRTKLAHVWRLYPGPRLCLLSISSWCRVNLTLPFFFSPACGPSLMSSGLYCKFGKEICTGVLVAFLPEGTWASFANFPTLMQIWPFPCF